MELQDTMFQIVLKVKPSSSRTHILRPAAMSQELCLPRINTNLQVNGKEHHVKFFIGSGADFEFINLNCAKSLGIQMQPTTKPRSVLALDGHALNQSSL